MYSKLLRTLAFSFPIASSLLISSASQAISSDELDEYMSRYMVQNPRQLSPEVFKAVTTDSFFIGLKKRAIKLAPAGETAEHILEDTLTQYAQFYIPLGHNDEKFAFRVVEGLAPFVRYLQRLNADA